jgi:hypothetical protein
MRLSATSNMTSSARREAPNAMTHIDTLSKKAEVRE